MNTAKLSYATTYIGIDGFEYATGIISEDSKGRFPDGARIDTSKVEKIVKRDGKCYIATTNTIYEVI